MKIKSVTIVSLSRGILGEPFIKHETDIGVKRLEDYGPDVRFSEHALSGIDFIAKHPECRAQDLLDSIRSDTDMILCAVGGDDTCRLLPYLFDHGEPETALLESRQKYGKDKVFLGFSDTTMNHLMLHKTGLNTFYGQAFLPDVCELGGEMLPYTRHYFEELLRTGTVSRITPSGVWYDSREDFSPAAVGTGLPVHPNEGFALLQGKDEFEGEILGGCIDSLWDIFNNDRYEDSVEKCAKYGLFPSLEDWKGKILLLESSEEKPAPEHYRAMLTALRDAGVFGVISGVLIGKPDGETYFEEYKAALKEVLGDTGVPVVININVGHSVPRCVIPFGVHARVSVMRQEIVFG